MHTRHKLGLAIQHARNFRPWMLFRNGASGFLPDPANPDRVRQTYNAPATTAASAGDPVGLWLPQAPGGEAVVNLLLWTDAFNNAIWTGSATVSPNTRNNWQGVPIAALLNATAGGQDKSQAYTCAADAAVRMGFVDLEAGTAVASTLSLIYTSGNTYTANISWSGGVPTVTHADSATSADVGATLMAAGVYRIWVKGANTSRTTLMLRLLPAAGSTGTVYASSAQVHDGSSMVSYQPNAGCLGGSNRRTGGVNLLVNTETLATQNVTVIAQAYTLNFTGGGTVTLSGAHTAGPLSAGTTTFTPSAGTLTLTVSGTVTQATLQIGSSFTGYTRNMESVGGLLQSAVLYQSTTGNRGTRARRPLSGILNAWGSTGATTEDFTSASWTPTALTITANTVTAPDGTLTADTVAANGASSAHWFGNVTALPAIYTGAQSDAIYVKANTGRFLQIAWAGTATPYANFDLQLATSSPFGAGTTAAIVDAVVDFPSLGPGSGWYKISGYTTDVAATGIRFAIVTSLASARLESSTSTASFYLWGANKTFGAATVGPYQKVVSTADITQAGQPDVWHTLWDGVSDFGTFGVQSFGTASLFAAAGQSWTVWGCWRSLALFGSTISKGTAFNLLTSQGTAAYVSIRGTNTALGADGKDGVFHTFAARWDGSTMKVWMDSLAAQTVGVGSLAEPTTEIAIAGLGGGAGAWLSGHCDAAMIDRALSDAEMAQLMSNLNATYRAGL